MSVYMEPLIDDLVRAWEEGVWTYDRATKINFKMHVWYLYSLHDLSAYGIFYCWCVHGRFPCPRTPLVTRRYRRSRSRWRRRHWVLRSGCEVP